MLWQYLRRRVCEAFLAGVDDALDHLEQGDDPAAREAAQKLALRLKLPTDRIESGKRPMPALAAPTQVGTSRPTPAAENPAPTSDQGAVTPVPNSTPLLSPRLPALPADRRKRSRPPQGGGQ